MHSFESETPGATQDLLHHEEHEGTRRKDGEIRSAGGLGEGVESGSREPVHTLTGEGF